MDDRGGDRNRYGFERNVFEDHFPSRSSTPFPDTTPRRNSRTPPNQFGLVSRVSNVIIEMRCTDRALLMFAASLGVIVIVMQTLPIFTDQWVLTTEPRPINRTDENDVQLDTTFQFNAGYFQFCRFCQVNETGLSAEDLAYFNQPEFKYRCYWNPILTGEDMTEVSIATVAILQRLHISTVMHLVGTFICVLALGLGLIGHNQRDVKTLHSAILYVAGGLIVCVAVLQFICVVDDEMTPRMKPNASGEQSKYSFEY
uniref:Uncharacterized protein n=1 Tax=Plectus sambesii TaxID=2011161 RepID=A0A914V025_9BILA